MIRHGPVILALVLLGLYPVAWTAPMLRAGLLPIFGLNEISVISGIVSLMETDFFLAAILALFALFSPTVKILWLLGLNLGWHHVRAQAALAVLGRLAMAEVFLVSIYITAIKGIGVGRLEIAWGLYLFTLCVLASLVLDFWTQKRLAKASGN